MKKAALILGLLGIMMLGVLFAKEGEALKEIQAIPNPMERHTDISFVFNKQIPVQISIQNGFGDVIKSLYSGTSEHYFKIQWDRIDDFGNYVPAGDYYIVVTEGRYTSTKKTLILK
ncbi:MAG: hypothetical protein GX135_07420 [Candidatus Cloacimonetes bacterium]|nr:hypothetical protein [Candidatus Cloacimonadota bacterium]